MAFFALLWKARTIEKYRINYETEKINSIVLGNTQMEQTLSQRWSHYRRDTKKRISRTFKKWYPEGSGVANFFLYLRTDQTFPNFLLKSVMGFVGGIILTYLCFMFFVFQLSISLIHATIMSSIIGVLLTLGLAFSYRIRCLVFLLIPQFFSRVGRYTLTCYALVLILTGPATNTLKNSEVLSESMACSQEQIKASVHQLNDLMKKPFNTMKDSLKVMVDRLKTITTKVKETVVELDRLVLSIVSIIQSSFSWLQSVADICNAQLGTPYDRCSSAMEKGISDCKKHLGPDLSKLCDVAYVAQAACYSVKPFKAFCYATDFMDEAILASVKKKIRNFSEHLRAMFHVEVHMHHSYSYSSNTSRSASQVAAGIVTEIRNRADPLLTWLSWSSCVTSLFLLLIIFRAKYYQHMYETRSRFDNRYVTKELQELDLKRQRQGRETVLPLNRRERAKYINTTSFRLVASEKVYLNRSAVFMAITTFKLLIHMVADYSLYWVLMTIRYHGRYQTELMPGIPHSGAHVSGSGYVARLFSSIIGILDIPLSFPAPSPITCLPDPYPPDLRRYTQIGVLIFLLWFFALFEPYGLRLRHLIMGHYRPERAKARATWLYNHILRTRASFMKFARRKLHRDYKYSSGSSLTFRQWITDHIPFQCLRSLLGLSDKEPYCLLCGITPSTDPESELTRCKTRGCPGVYCMSCFQDIGNLCTICLSPEDYGDLSDVSFEKGSDDSDDEHGDPGGETMHENVPLLHMEQSNRRNSRKSFHSYDERWQYFNESGPTEATEAIELLPTDNYEQGPSTINILRRFYSLTSNLRIRCKEKQYTLNWVTKLHSENTYKIIPRNNDSFHSLPFEMEETFSETKSIGINTDKNRSMIISLLMNNFRQRRIRFSRNKHKNMKSSNKHSQLFRFHNDVSFSSSDSEPQVKHSVSEPNRKTTVYTKTLHSYNLNIPLVNTNNNVKNKDNNKEKNKMNLSKEFKGTMSVMKYFMKSSDMVEVSNQNNGITLDNNNTGNPPIDNAEEVNNSVGDADNPELPDKKKKKKSKNKKQKRQRKTKDAKKIKKKDSRHGINEIHTFFSTHWNNFKGSLMKTKRSDSSMAKEKKNHKRRKKRKSSIREVTESDTDECLGQKDTKQTRNLRISAFLAELDWTKKEYRKGKSAEAKNDSFLFRDGQRTVATNKIVGMVHLKNLPFQWREAPKKDPHCDCQDKKCSCPDKSEKCMNKIFGRLSKFSGKLSTKKKIQKFRNKISTLDAPSSLMAKMLSTINAKRDKSSAKLESSICIAKRASFYREVAKELLQNEESFNINTDMLFKNENFISETLQEPPSEDIGQSSKFISSNTLLGNELIVSQSTEDKALTKTVNSRCRCDFYDDIQRKWTHVKKSLSDKFKTPIGMMKNLRSSLFGPSCTTSTCPNKKDPPKPVIIRENKRKLKIPTIKSSKKNKPVAIQTDKKNRSKMGQMAVQTNAKKDMETQLKEDDDVEKYIKEEMKKAQAKDGSAKFDADVCKQQMKLLLEALEKEKEKLAKLPPKSELPKPVEAKPSVEKPAAKKPEAHEPKIDKPAAKKPEAQEPKIDKPAVIKSEPHEPKIDKPAAIKPEVRDPELNKPVAKKPEPHEPEIIKSAARKSEAREPEINKSAARILEARDPELNKPAARKSESCKSETYKPATRKSDSCKLETYKPPKRKSETYHPPSRKSDISSHPECACPTTPPPPTTECVCTNCENLCVQKSSGAKQLVIDDPGNTSALQQQDEGINVKPSTISGGCQAKASPTCCNRSAIVRFEKRPRSVIGVHTAVGSSLRCLCDEGVQGSLQDTCTCATQHEPQHKSTRTKTTIVKPVVVSSFTLDDECSLAIKKNQHRHVAHKGTHFSKHRRKKSRDVKSGVSKRDQKLSLESSLCVLNRSSDAAKTLTEVFTDTLTDSSVSSVSIRSQETKTDTTVCSLATVDYDTPRRRKFRVKVVTKTNQSTFMDKTRLRDTGTVTQDWWSPLVERKGEDNALEKKKGYNITEKQKREKKELKRRELKEMRDLKKRRNCGVTTDGRIVTFRSRTQIIPTGAVTGVNDIMSPSRYLRESQRYYNELFAYNFFPAQMEFNCVSQIQKHLEKDKLDKLRSPMGTRRNHHRKTKRLEECYSPRRQISPRKRFTESESPRKRHTPRHTNNRHYSKYLSPRKFK